MKSLAMQTMQRFTSHPFFLSTGFLLLLLLPASPSQATIPTGTIQRTTKQQILATVAPGADGTSEPFLTSPSGTYTAYLLRRGTAPGAGGYGNDFCYVQVQDAGSGQGVWESECAPVSGANACSLVFWDAGLGVFDGSRPAWDTGAPHRHRFPASLDLVDEGDMRIIDKEGELVWKASDEPLLDQGCGLAPEKPPFAAPIGGAGNLPFGAKPLQQPEDEQTPSLQQQLPPPPPEEEQPLAPPSEGDQQLPLPLPLPSPSPSPSPTEGDQQLPPPPSTEGEPPLPPPSEGDQQLPPPPSEEEEPPSPPEEDQPLPPAGQQQQQPLAPEQQQQPLGFQQQQQPPQQQGLNGLQQPVGGDAQQPLVDNTPYDSGSPQGVAWLGMTVALQITLWGYAFMF